MRLLLVLTILLLPACGWLEREREEAAVAARAAAMADVERILAEAVRRADGAAASADRVLSPLPVMTPAEENRLRLHLGSAHVAMAREAGARVLDRATLDSLVDASRLVRLADSTEHWIVRERAAPAHVLPSVETLLGILGERFQGRLDVMGLPPYRIEVTSALRTSERQARLRRSNATPPGA